MKNIHVLPTDKPSRLIIYSTLLNEFRLLNEPIEDWKHKRNIYITSDSKFVRDEYITDGIEVIKATSKLVDAQGLVGRRDWNKIIITTDPELIKDGVHPIGEDFLKWFVENPTCIKVEVVYGLFNPMGRQVDPNDLGQNHSKCVWKYKIITTKEKQKQHLIDMMKSDEELGLYDEPKQELSVRLQNSLKQFNLTLEEAMNTETYKLKQIGFGNRSIIELQSFKSKQEIKLEDIFNDEKREGAKRVIHQHKVLKGLYLINPAHLEMTSNGYGEFPDGYKLTHKGIQYIIEQLNKE
jgi:hypothetical protein